ncbi:protein of unknown function (plasmid) [Shinella sp. WSC3-e]|nr:protein of unknown function [Shinella sp. WSC3-e]
MISGIVGHDDPEIRMSAHHLVLFLQRENTTVVGQRMDDDGSVLPGFHYFIEIAYRAKAGRHGKWAVVPLGAVGVEQKSPYEIGGRHVFVTGNGHQGLAETPCHVFHETGLATSGRPLEHDGDAHPVSGLEQRDFLTGGAVKRLLDDREILQGVGYGGSLIEVGPGLHAEILR